MYSRSETADALIPTHNCATPSQPKEMQNHFYWTTASARGRTGDRCCNALAATEQTFDE